MKKTVRIVVIFTLLMGIIKLEKSAIAAEGDTTRVSVSSSIIQGNGNASGSSISETGRYISFSSEADNLVSDDTNGVSDIFVHDNLLKETRRVSIGSDGTQANGLSRFTSISADGRYVAFISSANNLVPGDTNGVDDGFVHDLQTGETERVTVASDGTQSTDGVETLFISAGGRFLSFSSFADNLVEGDTNYTGDCFVHDMSTGETFLVSIATDGTQGNNTSTFAKISRDGRYVAFVSDANNLVHDDTNNVSDIFLHDRLTKETTRVSVASDGSQGNASSMISSMSADGQYVAFTSFASNLVSNDTNDESDIFLHDWQSGETTRVSVFSDGSQGIYGSFSPSISSDGNFIAFLSNGLSGDLTSFPDIYIHNRITNETAIVSVASDGTQANDLSSSPSISPDGQYIGFYSFANNLVGNDTNDFYDSFVYNRENKETIRISNATHRTQANNGSNSPSISEDGRFIAFDSDADNLVPNDTNGFTDIFIHDQQTGETERVSIGSDGSQANDKSSSPSISGDGQFVVFTSDADNLVEEDTNGLSDIFIHNQKTGETKRVSISSEGTQAEGASSSGRISADGNYAAFNSDANNLVPDDNNGSEDNFVRNLLTGETTRVSIASDGTEANDHSFSPSLSADGRYVAFASSANNLVPEDTNDAIDSFVHDRQAGVTTRISVASDGTQAEFNSLGSLSYINADGHFIVFSSEADNLVPNDKNEAPDVFVHDRLQGETTRISVSSDGVEGNDFSFSYSQSISGDGRYVAFHSTSDNLVESDTNDSDDSFVHDRQTGETIRVSIASDGSQGDGYSVIPALSADGNYVAFISSASNLVVWDTNEFRDVFVHHLKIADSDSHEKIFLPIIIR